MKYSRDLKQYYTLDAAGTVLTFDDGVKYTVGEALGLAKADGDAVRAVHAVKKIFDGELIIPGGDYAEGISRMFPQWKRDGVYKMPQATSGKNLRGQDRPKAGPKSKNPRVEQACIVFS